MGHRVKARVFDNSTREATKGSATTTSRNPIPGSAAYARQHPASDGQGHNSNKVKPGASGNSKAYDQSAPPLPSTSLSSASGSTSYSAEYPAPIVGSNDGNVLHSDLPVLQDALRALNVRPPTPAAFVATTRVKHDALCAHLVTSCPTCSCGLVCCMCKRLFTPAVARHLACGQCQHVAYSCCHTAFCCKCGKPWLPSDSVLPLTVSTVQRFRGGAGSGTTSSPEPDIWTPSPRSSPDEIDDLTARAALPLPASRSESDASRAPSRA